MGVEIGALHLPLKLYHNSRALYVDNKPVDELRHYYPELGDKPFYLDIVDDGEHLKKFRDASLDFVVANHFLEHCEDPIRTIENFTRVLKDDGIIFMAVPDKRFTFDCDRPVTSLEHLLRDHIDPSVSRESHFKEFEKYVQRGPVDRGYSIHYHVWTIKELKEFTDYVKCVGVEPVRIVDTNFENIVVLRKSNHRNAKD
jgi:SAM-dependent methyltransferase